MTGRYDHLFVLWREPTTDGTRHVIGHLRRERDGFAFSYAKDVADACARGFRPLIELPDVEQIYAAPYLFSTFAQRIPNPQRPDCARLLASWGVEHADDQMEILAKSGGIQATDRIELSEYRSVDDALAVPLLVRVAGASHHAGGTEVAAGDALTLEREPLPIDPFAVRLRTSSGASVGYVPRQYSALVARLLDGGASIGARTVRLLPDPDVEHGRWVVELQRSS